MAPTKLLDTHIHLWPATAASSAAHSWMTPGHFLATRHGIAEYKAATAGGRGRPDGSRFGFVYVETDRRLADAVPEVGSGEDGEGKDVEGKLRVWAQEPLSELAFLRRIVEGTPVEGGADGFTHADSSLLKGMVIYAPFHLSASLFAVYLRLAREGLGEKAWSKVVGFRYLLQGRGVESVRRLVRSDDFVSNLRSIEGKVFDVGVDCHRDGLEVLECVVELVQRVERAEGGVQPRFVLNHLCKPNLSSPSTLATWSELLAPLATHPNVAMKLSGAFNEFEPAATPTTIPTLLSALKPYFDHIYDVFGPERIMFGSDWPVCNVGGPRGEVDEEGRESNWGVWRGVVEAWMEERGFGEEIREGVWWRGGARAYGLGEL